MARLSEIERAERRMMRAHLEAMSVQRLRELARKHEIDIHSASTKLCIVNTLMNNYDKW